VIQQARQTLEAKDKQGARRAWANSVRVVAKGYTLKPVELAEDTLSHVYEAITRQRQLSIVKDEKTFVVHPLGLVMRGLVHYLVCTYQGYGDIRITALHRLTATSVLPGKRHVPAGFNLDEILASGLMHWRLEPGHVKPFEIEVSGAMVGYFEDNRFTDEQQITLLGKDSAVIAFVEEDTLELRQWLLGFGEDVKVLKPVEVRDWLLAKAKGIVGRYDGKRRR
ncbi:MAG TPA: WYL domain-containing protein, partial [Pseudomonadales bacterium]|nr:WYL domain-containing protein [Pseudomonadales bacterium]